MESHGGTPVDETGLEGPMWQLGLSDGPESYPERPGEPDCSYYLRTGTCGYGDQCRFNHQRDRSVAIGTLQASGGEYPERIGQAVCQHYMRTGTCKFGSSCKYHHPRGSSAPVVAFNFYGYPLRPGEEDCAYYVKTGRCKFGANCKFHHPQPAGAELPPPPTMASPPALPPPAVYPPVQESPSQQYGNLIQIPRPTMLSTSYISGSYGPIIIPPQGIVTVPSWTPYPVYASDQPAINAGPAYGLSQLSTSTMSYAGPVASYAGPSREHGFPQRPGEPECQYYLRTGDCKFGSNCKYHHPPEPSLPNTGLLLSPMGLPLRPGAPICFHYSRNGVCRFGPSCKFDHPIRAISYSSSTSSLTDLPVAPYPVGGSSKNTTMAPSSSTTSRSRLKDDLSSSSNARSGPISMQRDSNTSSSHGV